jgi:hypothetical protein
MFLTPDELRELTGKARSSAQARALRAMGIEHRARPDGSLAVSRLHVEGLLGGTAGAKVVVPKQPNWSALDAIQTPP